MNDLSSWRLLIITDSKRFGCMRCDFWTGPHRFWFMASRELRRHVKNAHSHDR